VKSHSNEDRIICANSCGNCVVKNINIIPKQLTDEERYTLLEKIKEHTLKNCESESDDDDEEELIETESDDDYDEDDDSESNDDDESESDDDYEELVENESEED